MDQVLEVMRNVTIFILLFSIVINLFSQSKYRQFFKFIEGVVVILLVMTPMFAWLMSDSFLDQCMEQNYFQMEQDSTKDEIELIGEKRDELILKGEQKVDER